MSGTLTTGNDTSAFGNGKDTFNVASGTVGSGQTDNIDGGQHDADTILLTTVAGTTADFSFATISNVEVLTGSAGNDTVTLTLAQYNAFAAVATNVIDLAGGTNDVLNIKIGGTVDLTANALNKQTNTETLNITANGTDESLTINAS